MEREEYNKMFALEETHWWYWGLRRFIKQTLAAFLAERPATMILDAGCGTGGMLKSIGDICACGLDLSETAISFCRHRGLKNIVRANLNAIPYHDGIFDAVICQDVLYHQQVSSDTTAVKEMSRVLKKGGLLILHEPAYESLKGPHDIAVHGRKRYVADEIRKMVLDAGLVIEKISYRNTLLLPLFALIRYMSLFRNMLVSGKKPVSSLGPVPVFMNFILKVIMRAENAFVSRMNMSFGLSVFCVARKGISA